MCVWDFGSLAELVWLTSPSFLLPCLDSAFFLSSSRALSYVLFFVRAKSPELQLYCTSRTQSLTASHRAKPGNRDKNVFRSRHFLCPLLELFFWYAALSLLSKFSVSFSPCIFSSFTRPVIECDRRSTEIGRSFTALFSSRLASFEPLYADMQPLFELH